MTRPEASAGADAEPSGVPARALRGRYTAADLSVFTREEARRFVPQGDGDPRNHAVLAWDKHSKAMGLLASDRTPEGFLSSRIDFIGRARSLWTPGVLGTLAFSEAA